MGCWVVKFNSIQLKKSVRKQWRSWSDAAFCGVWSGSALFAYVPQKDARLIYGLITSGPAFGCDQLIWVSAYKTNCAPSEVSGSIGTGLLLSGWSCHEPLLRKWPVCSLKIRYKPVPQSSLGRVFDVRLKIAKITGAWSLVLISLL